MHGSPILRALIVVVVLLLAAIPVWSLTHQARAANHSAEACAGLAHDHTRDAHVCPYARGFPGADLGKVILSGKDPGFEFQKDVEMDFPKEGIDLEVKADWPPATPYTAVRVAVRHGYGTVEKTAWGKDNVDEVLTFQDPK